MNKENGELSNEAKNFLLTALFFLVCVVVSLIVVPGGLSGKYPMPWYDMAFYIFIGFMGVFGLLSMTWSVLTFVPPPPPPEIYAQPKWKPKPPPKIERMKFTKRKPPSRAGYVYLLKSSTGMYKIGRTAKPKDRLKTFEVKLPFEIEYEHLIHTGNMNKLERELHARFKSKRANGEWFDLSEDDVQQIKAIKGLPLAR